jgi:hypothetical protein
VKAWLEPLSRYLDSRSLRERWLMVASGSVVAIFAIQSFVLAPLAARSAAAIVRREQLDSDLLKARRLAAEIRNLQGAVAAVEAQVASGGHGDLSALLEGIARSAGIRGDQIESVKPTPVSGNPKYPETRVQVVLRTATLPQTVRFLHAIENHEARLILRSLQVRKGRGSGDSGTLDVTVAVSTFSSGTDGARSGT